MKSSGFLAWVWCVTCLTALLGGCSSKKDANSELQRAVVVMAQPDPVQAAPAPEPAPQSPAATPAPQPVAPAKAQAQEMNQAMVAYKAGNLDDAVVRLQKLRATPVMSAEKRIAVNDATAAVMSEIYALAGKGDARAIQAVKLYEEIQTQRR
jgi:hypothetical protein